MRWGNLTKFLVVVLAILTVAGYYMLPLALSIKQGLDLQGGTHVVLEASDTPEAQVNDDAMQRVVHIIERRINELGLTEPIVQRQGERRIIVELPGVKDPEKAIEMLGRTALMEFQDESGAVVLTGKDLKDAKAQIDQSGQKLVAIEFTDEGAKKFANLTAKNVGKHIAILLDKQILTNPVVQEAIPNGKAVISGNRTIEEAERLAILLRSGALPVKVDVLETRTVGPSLGEDSKAKSMQAFVIGIACIVTFMLFFYRLSGFVANVSLVLFVMLLLFGLKMLNATLTLPGIAGIILSMGMAVDANVLIFERFKEECRAGKTLRSAMDAGFNRAFATIIDTNATHVISAAVLFFLGTGPIKGFAVTLGLGIILSLFTAITATRFLLKMLIHANVIKDCKFYGA
ncbi:protein translocase subunit SecD [Sporomusa sp.]|uniref:protein translocase subunit SecD n=1 Tax=Sporomusa sp. TaxID=2078658 RepID=UPI002BFC5265|nr:protein translocase subunit SecD [Sporomusa sp.]HWR45362.1 protein translocase subunit SecD [Sporomusa sp.]